MKDCVHLSVFSVIKTDLGHFEKMCFVILIRGVDSLGVSSFKSCSKVENQKGSTVQRRGSRRGPICTLPFCPRTQRCSEGWGGPLAGCFYYNLLQVFFEISVIRDVRECGRNMLTSFRSTRQQCVENKSVIYLELGYDPLFVVVVVVVVLNAGRCDHRRSGGGAGGVTGGPPQLHQSFRHVTIFFHLKGECKRLHAQVVECIQRTVCPFKWTSNYFQTVLFISTKASLVTYKCFGIYTE